MYDKGEASKSHLAIDNSVAQRLGAIHQSKSGLDDVKQHRTTTTFPFLRVTDVICISRTRNFTKGSSKGSKDLGNMTLQAIKYSRGKLQILDQLRLPHDEVYIDIKSPEDAWDAIKSMQVRGAPAIALVAALSVAVDIMNTPGDELQAATAQQFAATINRHLRYLVSSRPTAVNLADAAAKLMVVVENAANESNADSRAVMTAYLEAAERMLIDDVQDNERIGKYGADWLLQHTASKSSGLQVSVITHCNTG